MLVNVLLRLIMAHLIGDFVLQPRRWVRSWEALKLKSGYLYLHNSVVIALSFLFLWDWTHWYLPICIGILHLAIDARHIYAKNTLTNYLFDQLLHLLTLLGLWLVFYVPVGAVATQASRLLSDNHVWGLSIGLYTLIWPLGIAIGKATEKWQKSSGMNAGGLEKAGLWIGRCERVLVFTFILSHEYTALGFLMASKSLLRFADKDEMTQKKTEYILVGTLISFASAAIIGVVVSFLIQ